MEQIPDNLKATIMWLIEKWGKAQEDISRYGEGAGYNFEDFVCDWIGVGLATDESLTEDALELKRFLRGL